ncbi:hypothetical protein M378DRAFT_82296 [Amanita muscaria Koide BX008]|uniref:Tetratricopeptide repeat protein 39B n=1 Tax=Amanita muscaria (strain Koide BX008) TaxID=946122 RepID=A0A0C2WJG4_AMAMK|nr:hypothetical protein M378DRAFT_82296 [Amanita muscaria Koide BX008]
MLESEEFCDKSDEKKQRLYFASGYGLIQSAKGLMSFADDDLLAGLAHTRQATQVANQHRKKQSFIGSLVSSLQNPVGYIKSMTPVEQHAELVYAESLFEKSLLGIAYSGDWLAFIKEVLNMRATMSIYRQLGQYLDTMDAEARARGEPEDTSIDVHFRSGVYLGVGMNNIILSLMPGKLQTLVELFGYKGDRQLGLEFLMKAGGWSYEQDEPSVNARDEGVRRAMCDMTLLIFHLFLSSFTFDGIDISIAQKIIDWNLKRYPNGVFFLFGAGRLSLCHSQPQRALEYYNKALTSQSQYMNLHHLSFWEIALANFCLWDIPASLKHWKILNDESTWSKAIYTYCVAACMLETSNKEGKREAAKLMLKVPELKQKIAGKSIPFEKFVARKARKFQSQKNRLVLPTLELAYLFLAISHAPRSVIADKMLPEVYAALQKIEKGTETDYQDGGYWDDYCLTKFLEGVCLRYIAYPEPDATIDPDEIVSIPKGEAEAKSVAAFKFVFENGPKIDLDHYIVYHAHYEYGRILRCQGNTDEAREQFELILSGKPLEVGPSGKKGRYSMENPLQLRSHAALEHMLQYKQMQYQDLVPS